MKDGTEGKRKIKDIFIPRNISPWTGMGVAVAVVFILFLLTIMFLLPFGMNPINRRAATVRSNSMDPTFERGDIVFLEEVDAAEVEEGDIIALQVPERYQEEYGYPSTVIHRVTRVEEDEGRYFFYTRGDAEEQEDLFVTPSQNIIGGYSDTEIPYLGLLFLFANTTLGMITLTLVFALLLVAVYFPWHIDKKEERGETLRELRESMVDLKESMNSSRERTVVSTPDKPTTSRGGPGKEQIMMKMNENGKASISIVGDSKKRESEGDIILEKKEDGKGAVKSRNGEENESKENTSNTIEGGCD